MNTYSEAEEENELFECTTLDSSPRGAPVLTYALIIISVLVTLFEAWNLTSREYVLTRMPIPPCILSNTCLFKTILAIFIHANLIHLLFNMIFLYIVGDNIEIGLGRLRFLIVFLISGLMSIYVQALYNMFLDPSKMTYTIVGASGAISGLIGSYLLLYPGSTTCICRSIFFAIRCYRVKVSVLFGIFYAIQLILLPIFQLINIAVWGHLAGLVTGYSLTYILANKKRIKELQEEFARGEYVGSRIPVEELAVYSLPASVRGLVVFLAIIILSISIIAFVSPTQYEYDGKYFIVYKAYAKKYYRQTICYVQVTYSNGKVETYRAYGSGCGIGACPDFTLLKIASGGKAEPVACTTQEKQVVYIHYEYKGLKTMINDTVIESPYENKTRKIVVVRSISLDNISETVTALFLINLFQLLLTIYISTHGYRELEITRYPKRIKLFKDWEEWDNT